MVQASTIGYVVGMLPILRRMVYKAANIGASEF
jgi:hypothetical protein